ncbi:hypothetical protein [Kitasatospora sp. NPDC088783]|uniref:hypothetical protein n=1 Tax=Kitasatospora sp. NPDC088783 TaxID=3364077 RepID=UPI0037FA113E
MRRARRAVAGLLEEVATRADGHPAEEAYLYAALWARQAEEAARAGEDDRAGRCGWAAQRCAETSRALLAGRGAAAAYPSPFDALPPGPRRRVPRALREELERRLVRGRDLPPIGYAHRAQHDPALTAPDRFRPAANHPQQAKPAGGLWCAPLREGGSEWTRYADDGDELVVTAVRPSARARVYRIDTAQDLQVLAAAYPRGTPDGRPPGRELTGWASPRVDWAAASRHWAAVHLTERGQQATHACEGVNLFGWDVETVLFLRPAYRL